MWEIWNTHSLLVGFQTDAVSMEFSVENSQKAKNKSIISSSYAPLWYLLKVCSAKTFLAVFRVLQPKKRMNNKYMLWYYTYINRSKIIKFAAK